MVLLEGVAMMQSKEKFGNEGPRRMDEAGLVDGCVVKVTGKFTLPRR